MALTLTIPIGWTLSWKQDLRDTSLLPHHSWLCLWFHFLLSPDFMQTAISPAWSFNLNPFSPPAFISTSCVHASSTPCTIPMPLPFLYSPLTTLSIFLFSFFNCLFSSLCWFISDTELTLTDFNLQISFTNTVCLSHLDIIFLRVIQYTLHTPHTCNILICWFWSTCYSLQFMAKIPIQGIESSKFFSWWGVSMITFLSVSMNRGKIKSKSHRCLDRPPPHM